MPTPPSAENEPDGSRRPNLVTRRMVTGGAAAVSGAALFARWQPAAHGKPARRLGDGFGSVVNSPNLPAGFRRTFRSVYVEANGIRQHVVVGGDGPPLLLIHGWPENWYAWRFVMPELARRFTVIVPDQRGIGLTTKTEDGYDSATLASDLAALMTALGHSKFAVVGHDTGYIVGYALAADHRARVERIALAEIPGPPGVQEDPTQPPPPPMFVPEPLNNKLWHIPFNRVNDELILDMVSSNADAYYRYEYNIQGGGATLPDYAIDYYIRLFTRTRTDLRASFGLYRAWDHHLAQNIARQQSKLTIPVLGIGGANSWGPFPGDAMRAAATNVQTLVIPGCGHWVAEQAPQALLSALGDFLTPYAAAAAA